MELYFFCVGQVSVNSVFQEVTLRLDVSDQEKQWLLDQTKHVKKKSYIEEKLPAGVQETDRARFQGKVGPCEV